MSKTNGFLNNSVDNPHPNQFHIQSKDKRNQISAVEVKTFVNEDNLRRNMIIQ